MDMANFLIGRGADGTLQLLSANAYESRQEAMVELSRITSESSFSQWDLEVFVVDLDAGVPVLLVRPQSGDPSVDVASEASEASDVDAQDGDDATTEPAQADAEASSDSAEPCDESSSDLRDALQRTTEQMSAEGIVPPESAGLEPTQEPSKPQAEPPTADDIAEEEPEASLGEDATPDETEPDAIEDAPEADVEDVASPEQQPEVDAVQEGGEQDQAWPWSEAPPAPAAEPGVSPEIADVYQGLEQMEQPAQTGESALDAAPEAKEAGSDFILDIDAIQPVAMEPQGSDAAAPPQQPVEDMTPDSSPEDVVTPPTEEPLGADEFHSSMTEYTCEDCVYMETCPNRGQREPKDCGSFQWK
jgi:hypothetical protein